jgi:hypothetical protein
LARSRLDPFEPRLALGGRGITLCAIAFVRRPAAWSNASCKLARMSSPNRLFTFFSMAARLAIGVTDFTSPRLRRIKEGMEATAI